MGNKEMSSLSYSVFGFLFFPMTCPIGLQRAYVSKSFFFSQVTSSYRNRSNSRIQIYIPLFSFASC